MNIQIKILDHAVDFYNKSGLPNYSTAGSAAIDLISPVDMCILPDKSVRINTGLAIWPGSNNNSIAALILPRSSLGIKGVVIKNTIGLIDADYQGELIVHMKNTNSIFDDEYYLRAGERFAQLMFIPIILTSWNLVNEFSDETTRGEGGFGSTNI